MGRISAYSFDPTIEFFCVAQVLNAILYNIRIALNLFRGVCFRRPYTLLDLLMSGALSGATSVYNLIQKLLAKFEWCCYILEQVG